MAKVVRTLKYVRGPVGKLFKWVFIAFNLLMTFWLFSYWVEISPMISQGSGAEQAGAALGSTIGTGLVLLVWVLGAVVLGIPVMLTKGTLVEIENSPTVASSSAPTQVIREESGATAATIVVDKDAAPSEWMEKLKLYAQNATFVVFLIVGMAFMMTNLLAGLAIIIAGVLFLPQVRKRLEGTPLGSRNGMALIILGLVLFSLYQGGKTGGELIENAKSKSGDYASTVQDNNEPQKMVESAKEADFSDNWSVSKDQSQMDDTPSITISRKSENSVKSWLDEVTPTLVIRCQENTTDVIFQAESNFTPVYGEYGKASIRVRIDDKTANSQYWNESTNSESVFAPNPISLLRQMKDAQTLKIEFNPFNANLATAEFDLRGLTPHLEDVAKTCKWDI
ncbi:type VI secretion system-associated protein TagO [Micavibrio aeruginosavorus]|uniref:type VI secretion system-associated protein TagO n=1 Tax=Micavibrio aeruginosavorus TaxID=349221 RepID=UPI003F4AEAA5